MWVVEIPRNKSCDRMHV